LSPELIAIEEAIAEGVDHVVLTGSAETGKAVLRQLAETLTPATMELSGCDAVFVLPGADLEHTVRALALACASMGRLRAWLRGGFFWWGMMEREAAL
jgi:acyl-CoA reductase-like NAD-dependent aldehyde dehydrogenase